MLLPPLTNVESTQGRLTTVRRLCAIIAAMAGKILVVVLLAIMLTGCSLDSFEFLHSLTSSLKGNIAIDAGLVDVDTSTLEEDLSSYKASLGSRLVANTDSSYSIEGRRLAMSDLGSILPVASSQLMDLLSSGSENSVKVDRAREIFSQSVDDGEVRAATEATVDLIVFLSESFSDYDFSYLIEAFSEPIGEDLTWRDVLSVVSSLLEHKAFDGMEVVTIDGIRAAISSGIEESVSFYDSLALNLGQGKTVARMLGIDWLYGALNGILFHFGESL